MEKDLEGYQMMDALSDYEFYEKGLVSQPVCAVNHIQPFLEKRPEKLWGYYCTGQYVDVTNRFIVQPGYRTRILGTQMYKYQLDGFRTGATTSTMQNIPSSRSTHIAVRMQQGHFRQEILFWYIRELTKSRKNLCVSC